MYAVLHHEFSFNDSHSLAFMFALVNQEDSSAITSLTGFIWFVVFWQRIYDLGARKFFVNNIPPAGCFPSKAIRERPRGNCDEKINKAISFYNRRLPEVLHELQSLLPGFSFVHADLFGFFKELRETGKSYGKKKSQMANQRAFESFWELLCRKCFIFMVKKLRIMLPWLVSKQNPN